MCGRTDEQTTNGPTMICFVFKNFIISTTMSQSGKASNY